MTEKSVETMKSHKIRTAIFWIMFGFFSGVLFIMFGFFSGVLFISSTMVNYERPYKWEDGGVITHQGKSYKLQEITQPDEKK